MADEEEGKEGENPEGQEGEGAADAAALKKKKRRKLILIAVAALLLAGGTAGGLYYAGIIGGADKTETTGKKGKKKKGGDGEHGSTGSSVKAVKTNLNEWAPGPVPGHENDDVSYYNLPEFLVNLNTGGKQTSFIKMKITLETASDEDIEAIESWMPRITDSFNTYLRELRSSDLSGSAGLFRLKEELLLRVNKTIYPSKVNDILFREMIIQ